jgi:hypothetical protein
MKTLINVERKTWGRVKEFATVRHMTLSLAVDQLLKHGLSDSSYHLDGRDEEIGKNA